MSFSTLRSKTTLFQHFAHMRQNVILSKYSSKAFALDSLSTDEVDDICRHLRSFLYTTPQFSVETMVGPLSGMFTSFFQKSGLSIASDCSRWLTFLLNIIANVVSLVTTTSSLMRGLNVACLVSITSSIILEIVSTVKEKARMEHLLKEGIGETIRLYSHEIMDFILENGGGVFPVDDHDEIATTKLSIAANTGMYFGSQVKSSKLSTTKAGFCLSDSDRDEVFTHEEMGIPLNHLCTSMPAAPAYGMKYKVCNPNGPGPLLVNGHPVTPTAPGPLFPDVTVSDSEDDSDVNIPTPIPSILGDAISQQQASKHHWYKIVKRVLAFVVCGAGLLIVRGDFTKMNHFITIHKFKEAVSKEFSSASEVVDWFCNEICGLEFHEEQDAINALQEVIAEADTLIMKPATEYGVDPASFLRLQKLGTSISKTISTTGSIKDPAINNLSRMLQVRSISIQKKIDDVWPVMQGTKTRQVPVPLLIQGGHGVGKTTFVQNVLIPKLAKALDLPPQVYSAKFTDSDKYWPEYGGQAFAIFDESFDKAEDLQDNFVQSFNSILSSGSYNMQGAFIKFQPCAFKFVFIITNRLDCPKFLKMLSVQAIQAFWNRLQYPVTMSVKKSHQGPTGTRGQHKFAPDWSHLQLEENFLEFASDTDPLWNFKGKPKNISYQALEARLVRAFNIERKQFMKSLDEQAKNCPLIQMSAAGDDTSNCVINIAGKSGVGKSYLVNKIMRRLAKYAHKDLNIHEGITRNFDANAFQVVHDFLPNNELGFNSIYDLCKHNLIITTHNCEFPKRRTHLFFKQISWEYGYDLSQFDSPATARRIGVPGHNYTCQGKVLTPSSEGLYFTMLNRGFVREMHSGKDYSENDAADLIWDFYLKYRSLHEEIHIQSGEIPANEPGIDIGFESIDVLKQRLSSLTGTARLLYAPTTENYLKISDIWSLFNDVPIDPAFFQLPSNPASLDEETTLKMMISKLRSLGVACTVRVSVGSCVYYAQHNTIIKNSGTAVYSYAIEQDIVNIYCTNGTTRELVFSIPFLTAIHGFAYGFSDYSASQLSLLHQFETELKRMDKAKLYLLEQAKQELKIQAARDIVKEKPGVMQLLKNHPLFLPVCATMAVVSTAAVAGVIIMITNALKPGEDDKEEVNIKPEFTPQSSGPNDEEKAYEAKARRLKANDEEIRVMRNIRERFDMGYIIEPDQKELDSARRIINFSPQVATLLDWEAAERRGLLDNPWKQQSISNLLPQHPQSYLLNKIEKATVIVSVMRDGKPAEAHGINIKGNLILTVAHLGDGPCIIKCDAGDVVKIYHAQTVAHMPDRDLQLIEVTDKTFPIGADLTKYFPKDDTPVSINCYMYILAQPKLVLPTELVPFLYDDFAWSMTKGGVTASYHTTRGEIIFQGYCGFMYLTSDTILAMHIGGRGNRRGLATIVSQGILQGLYNYDQQTSIPEPLQQTLQVRKFTSHDGRVLGERAVLPCSYHETWEDDISAHSFQPTPGLHLLAKVHFQTPYVRKDKFIPTGLQSLEELPNEVRVSPMKPVPGLQVCDIRGRPSIALNQIVKFGGLLNKPDDVILGMAQLQLREYFMPYMDKEFPNGVPRLTFKESVNGFAKDHPLHPYLEPMHMDSGCGNFWKHFHKVSKKGDFFHRVPTPEYDSELVLKNTPAAIEFGKCCHIAKYLILSDLCPLFINSDAMKSELLLKAKAEKGGTRMYSVADAVEVEQEREVFGPYMAVMTKYHEELCFKSGCNTLREFHWIYQTMKKVGKRVFSIDFERYDKNHPYEFVFAVFNAILDDPSLARIFAELVCKAVHHCFDMIYIREKGQNSGSAITTLLNMFLTFILLAYCYIAYVYRTTGKYPKKTLLEVIWMIVYNDDICYMERYPGAFPPEELKFELQKLGLTITYEETSVEDAHFLSRNFHCDSGTVYPQLKLTSFSRHLYWTSSKDPIHRADMYSLMLDEAAMYDKKFFSRMAAIIFVILEELDDVMTLSLIDWRDHGRRREAVRKLIFDANVRYMREPLSVGDLFSSFPTPKQFQVALRKRYSRTVELALTNNTIEFSSSENIFLNLNTPTTAIHRNYYNKNIQNLASSDHGSFPSYTHHMSTPADTVKVQQHDNISNIRSVAAPVVSTATASSSDTMSNESQLPVAPIPPIAITNANDTTAPLVVGNSASAPNILEAGGVTSTLITQAYSTWTRVDQITVASDVASGTLIYSLPWSVSDLPGAPGLWCSVHERCTGSLEYAVESIGSDALAGTITAAWVKDITQYTISDIERTGKWVNMPMNKTQVGHFVVPDVRKGEFWRLTSEVADHGIVVVVNVPLTNPFGVTGSTVTFNIYVRLGMDFQVALWKTPSVESSLSIAPFLTFEGMGLSNLKFLVDGYEASKTYLGAIVPNQPPLYESEFDASDGNPYTNACSGVVVSSTPYQQFMHCFPSNTLSPMDISALSFNYESTFVVTPNLGLRDALSSQSYTDDLDIVDWYIQWSDSAYSFYGMATPTGTLATVSRGATYDISALSGLTLPWTLKTWPFPMTNALPSDFTRIAFSIQSVPLFAETVSTALGRASVPPSLHECMFTSMISAYAGDQTCEFDIVSPYGNAAVLTCRFSKTLGYYARFLALDRNKAYYFYAPDMSQHRIVNLRIVSDASQFRPSPETTLTPRFSVLASSKLVPAFRKMTLQLNPRVHSFPELSRKTVLSEHPPTERRSGFATLKQAKSLNSHLGLGICESLPICYFTKHAVEGFTKKKVIDLLPVSEKVVKRYQKKCPKIFLASMTDYDIVYYDYGTDRIPIARVHRAEGYEQQATAAIIGLSMAGAMASAGAETAGSMFGKKKEREFQQAMQDDRQAFATQAATTGMDFQREMTGVNQDFQREMFKKQTEAGAASQLAGFEGQKRLNRQQIRAHGVSQFASIENANHMQAASFQNQAAMQEASFQHDKEMTEYRAQLARAAFGVTNPAMMSSSTQTSPTTNAGTQTGVSRSSSNASTQSYASSTASPLASVAPSYRSSTSSQYTANPSTSSW